MTEENIIVELLYFDDCPSWKNAHVFLKYSLKKLGISQKVVLIPVGTHEEAEEHKFTGSPMIRINGEDLFPTGQEDFALGCRVYQNPEGYKGWPTEEMIEKQIIQIINRSQ